MSSVPGVGPLAGHRLLDDPVSGAAQTTLAVGDRTVIAVSDGFFLLEKVKEFLGSETHPTAGHDALEHAYGEARLPVGAFLVPGDEPVLIDAGAGPVDVGGMGALVGGNLLRQLARHGHRREDIKVLALSHLHVDHVGWVADPEGNPTFPSAQVYLGRADWVYFVEQLAGELPIAENVRTALVTLAERDQVTLLDDDRQIAPGITRLAAPGHTPGHSLYAIHDDGERALLFGDAMYCPQQLTDADWAAASDVDPKLARRTREAYLRDLEEHGGTGLGCHFPQLRAGRIVSGAWQDA